MEAILTLLAEKLIEWGIDSTVKWFVHRIVDGVNKFCVKLGIDRNGDGLIDEDEVVAIVKQVIPDLSDGRCLCDNEDSIGIGYPEVEVVDSFEVQNYEGDVVAGDNPGLVVDYNADGDSDVMVPLPYDLTGDGIHDWVRLVDADGDGLPDANTELPFAPVGSKEYNDYISSKREEGSIIMVTPQGDLAIYDKNGELQPEDCDTAYSLWVSKYGIMDKPIACYSVTEGILFIALIVGAFGFFANLFRRSRRL